MSRSPRQVRGLSACPGRLLIADIDPDALITASQLADLAGVTVAAVCNWVSRGYLKPARDDRGRVRKDSRGCVLYRLLEGLQAEARTSRAAGRAA